MEKRLSFEREPDASGHRVVLDLGARGLQWPWPVVDVGAADALRVVERIEAVALGQPVRQGPRLRRVRLALRRVCRLELGGWPIARHTPRPVVDGFSLSGNLDPRSEVRQTIGASRGEHGGAAGGGEAGG